MKTREEVMKKINYLREALTEGGIEKKEIDAMMVDFYQRHTRDKKEKT